MTVTSLHTPPAVTEDGQNEKTPSQSSSHPSSRLSTPPSESASLPEVDSPAEGEDGEKDRQGKMLPPKEGRTNTAEKKKTTPPRMTRLPSLQQISTHLHLTPSSTPNPHDILSPPSTQITPPSLKILTTSSILSPQSNGASIITVNQSPYVASPSSRLRLPASAMMRTLSGGGKEKEKEKDKDKETIPAIPPFSISGPSPAKPVSSTITELVTSEEGKNDPFFLPGPLVAATPATTLMSPPNSTTSATGSPSNGRGGNTETFIKGYKDLPSLAEIGRRMSVTRGKTTLAQEEAEAGTAEGKLVRLATTLEVTVEKAEEVVIPLSAGSQDPIPKKKKEHPLQHAWTLYYDSKSYKPDPELSAAPGAPVLDEYEKSLLTVGKYDTVEGFARYMNNVRLPSQLTRNSNYHMFKNGIRPMWEDPANAKGGKWVLLIRSSPSLLDVAWANLAMALVGEVLDPDDQVCGIVASTRPKVDRIQVWTRGRDDAAVINGIGKRIVDALGLDAREMEAVSMEFQYNASNSAPPIGKFMHISFGPARSSLSHSNVPTSLPPTPTRLNAIPSSPLANGGFSPTFNTFQNQINGHGGLQPPLGTHPPALGVRRSSSTSNGGSFAFSGPMGGKVTPSSVGGGGGGGKMGPMGSRRGSDNGPPPGVRVGKDNGGW